MKDGVIEWQGSLKSTYDKYLHPDKLNLEDEEYYEIINSKEAIKIFQYSSPQGQVALNKIKPQTFQEICDGNALMRLSCDGEQPIDRYVKHKQDITLWYKEMKEVGLTQEEIEVLKKHLLKSYGVAPTQESVMRLSMDSKIANFTLVEANKLRKAIAKAKAKYMIKEVHSLFVSKGIENGNRELFLNYVWESFIVPQLGYAFSEPHIMGYSLILMQELHLIKLSALHWKVACLSVDSGDINEDIQKNTDYSAIAKAIANMEKGFVIPPYVNKAEVGFSADMKLQKAIYGLGAINGISMELARDIINLRPYENFQDFLDRCVKTKLVQPSKGYTLIKGGVFDEFEKDRVKLMHEYLDFLIEDKKKLTSANIPKLVEYASLNYLTIDSSVVDLIELFFIRKEILSKNNFIKAINKTQGYYRISKEMYNILLNKSDSFIDIILYDEDGLEMVSSKDFDKLYKSLTKDLNEYLSSEETLDSFNKAQKAEVWNKYCKGTIPKWEMDSLSYYTETHELEEISLDVRFKIENFFTLPLIPVREQHITQHTKRVIYRNKLCCISGVVVDRDKRKSMVTLNTEYGVVTIRMSKDMFTTFYRDTENEKGWLNKGNKLIILGYRRNENFITTNYSDTIFSSCVMKINVSEYKNEKGKFDAKVQQYRLDEDIDSIYSVDNINQG